MKSSAIKAPPLQDWHPADIKAALDKKGYSFARIARENGYARQAPNKVLRKPWSHVERIVAKIIGVKASEIWPSRYDKHDCPLKKRTARVRRKAGNLSEIKVVRNA